MTENNFLKKAFPKGHFKKNEEELEKLGVKPQTKVKQAKPNNEELKKLNEQLLHAALNGSLEEVKEALDKGADINTKDNDGDTPLTIASLLGHTDIAKQLIDKGANIETKNNEGNTPLALASYWGHTDIAKHLTKKEQM